MDNILLLASQSQSRRELLSLVKIPFVLVEQEADESECDWALPLPQLVASIAKHKMNQVIMPRGEEGQITFVLTADTLTQDKQGNLLPKPHTQLNAKRMLKVVRHGVRVGTAFCLDKKVFKFDSWQIEERVECFVESYCIFDVPDAMMDEYLQNSIALKASGAITCEGYGAQFFKAINGSYSTIIGLPLFELRVALEQLGFYQL